MELLDTLKVTVTQQDINEGIKGSCRRCPIALAVSRLIPDGIVVTTNNIQIFVDGKELAVAEYSLPHEALEFISSFDNPRDHKDFKTAQPLEFTMTKRN